MTFDKTNVLFFSGILVQHRFFKVAYFHDPSNLFYTLWSVLFIIILVKGKCCMALNRLSLYNLFWAG